MIEIQGSVRVDLLGGTLDLWPINLSLTNVKTLNVATSLKASVTIEEINSSEIQIESKDYHSVNQWKLSDLTEENLYQNDFFGPLKMIMQLIAHFSKTKALKLTLTSGSPPGAGLGGSSAMAVTVLRALNKFFKSSYTDEQIITLARNIEARILDSGPTGYQDYYPAVHGGILCLHANDTGVEVEQLFNKDFTSFLEKNLTLVFSNQNRLSGINNWEVFKKFVDKDKSVRHGLSRINELTNQAYQNIKDKKYDEFLQLISQEGSTREKLFPNIVTPEIKSLYQNLKNQGLAQGLKICGAGGGGCFLLTHRDSDQNTLRDIISKSEMELLDFKIAAPLT